MIIGKQKDTMTPTPKRFQKVVALDTIIFYPEHERLLKTLVEKPKVERVPLAYNQATRQWELPEGYTLPEEANIVIWPSSLPESFDSISPEIHEKLKTAQCWTETSLRDNISAQNLYNRAQGADCILTCWTNIPDAVLDQLVQDGKTEAIITWTHEFEHRLNVDKAQTAGIYTNSVQDYGTDAVAELELDGIVKLIERNKKTGEKAKTADDIAIGVLSGLFARYRKSDINEKNTRKGKFSHQFHKLGRAQSHYGSFGAKSLDDIIPEQLLEGKSVGILGSDDNLEYVGNVLKNGLKMNVSRYTSIAESSAEFYKFLAQNDTVLYDSTTVSETVKRKIDSIKGDKAIDLQELSHYDETLRGKTLGVIGLGRIGQRVAQIGTALGMNVQYTGPSEKGVSYNYVDLDTLLKTSDIVSVNVKAHKADGLLNEERIGSIPDGTYFINTSDGNAVDQEALTKRMLANTLYAAIDVYQGLPTTKTLGIDSNQSGKVGQKLQNHVLWYRAGWKTQESIRVKTYKLLGHMIEALAEMPEAAGK